MKKTFVLIMFDDLREEKQEELLPYFNEAEVDFDTFPIAVIPISGKESKDSNKKV